MLSHIYKMLTELPLKEGVLWFALPLKVQAPGLFPANHIWGASPQSNGDIILIDSDQQGYVLEASEASAQVMEELFHRLRLLNQNVKSKTLEGQV